MSVCHLNFCLSCHTLGSRSLPPHPASALFFRSSQCGSVAEFSLSLTFGRLSPDLPGPLCAFSPHCLCTRLRRCLLCFRGPQHSVCDSVTALPSHQRAQRCPPSCSLRPATGEPCHRQPCSYSTCLVPCIAQVVRTHCCTEKWVALPVHSQFWVSS